MSFAKVTVVLPAPPDGPTAEEEELYFVLAGLRRSPVVRQGMMSAAGAHPASKAARVALAAAQERLASLERYGELACQAVGRAWLEAGAPGSPRLKAAVDQRLEAARSAWRERYQGLLHTREASLQAAERRDAELRELEARARGSIARLDLILDLVESSQFLLEESGVARAWAMIEALPLAMRAGAARDDAPALGRWLNTLRKRLVLEREEALLADHKVQTRRLRNITSGVGVDAEILGGVRALGDVRGEQHQALDKFLGELGAHLLPHVVTFANGHEAQEALHAVRDQHTATSQRVAELTELVTELGLGPQAG
ncbi:MAG: hypothetical protein R3F39_13165 [Myxococcota bacterium]